MNKVLLSLLAIMAASCAPRNEVTTIVVKASDGKWEYIQTEKSGCVIAQYVDTSNDVGIMISRLYLDGEMNVLYYDEYLNGNPAYRYKYNGDLWVDFTKRDKNDVAIIGLNGPKERTKTRDEVIDAVNIATEIGFEALKMIK